MQAITPRFGRLLKPALILLLTSLALPATAQKAPRKMQSLRHVVLDPGHGGQNHGTPGAHAVDEKHLTLPIALEVERLLKTRTDAQVTLTRRSDRFVGLRDRTQHANRVAGDIFLSIHCNASPKKHVRGLEVYFLSADAASEEIQELIEREEYGAESPSQLTPGAAGTQRAPSLKQMLQEATMYRAHEHAEVIAGVVLDTLHKVLKAPRRGVHQAPFGVLKEAMMPALVVEVGYSSHPKEGKMLTSQAYQKKVALGIYKSLLAIDKRMTR